MQDSEKGYKLLDETRARDFSRILPADLYETEDRPMEAFLRSMVANEASFLKHK